MSKVKMVLKINGKTLEYKLPLPKITNKAQKRRLDKAIEEEVKSLRRHFRTGAWDINGDLCQENILFDYFGFDISLYIKGLLMSKLKGVTMEYANNECLIKSTKERVFYSAKENVLYIDAQARDVNNDIQLGEF